MTCAQKAAMQDQGLISESTGSIPKGFCIGILGCGNMGRALVKALSAPAGRNELRLFVWNRTHETVARLIESGAPVGSCATPQELAQKADIVFLCVKPPQIADMTSLVAQAFADAGKKSPIIVSIAAATSLDTMRKAASGKCVVARIMPTTTLAVGQGLFALVNDGTIPEESMIRIRAVLQLMGTVYEMTEEKLMQFSAAVGCAPGFIFHLLQGMVDGAVALGFPRPQAWEMVVGTTLGCALLARESNLPLTELRDQVTSPGGMTIQGVAVLERTGCRGHIMDALQAAYLKGMELKQ